MEDMITIDGSHGEGGGQIIRTALGLSTITGIPFRVTNIRSGRPQPGLKAQHVSCIEALKELCGPAVEGATVGSSELSYTPGRIHGKTISLDIGTAGSITLVLQSVLIPSLFADTKVRLKIRGGTDTKWSTPLDFFKEIILPQLQRFAAIDVLEYRRGYYPAGGGSLDIRIAPRVCASAQRTWGDFLSSLCAVVRPYELSGPYHLIQIKGMSHASKDLQDADVAERQAKSARSALSHLNVPVQIHAEYCETTSTGSGITLWAVLSREKGEIDVMNPIRIGADALGERGKRAEAVGVEAAKRLIEELSTGCCVDRHLADSLIPYLGLAGGEMTVSEITEHTRTNIMVAEMFLKQRFTTPEGNRIITIAARA